MPTSLNLPTERPPVADAPDAVLGVLADRFRAGGVFMVMLRPDGSVAWHDRAAGTFFTRYALPLIQTCSTTVQPAGSEWRIDGAAGLVFAGFSFVERRKTHGFIALVACEPSFSATEDVQRACSRLGVDAQWLCDQAAALPAYTDEAIARQAKLLSACLNDHLRAAGLEVELGSLSEQLASTYEELSLIYQISGGMKVNRGAGEFFKQACLDVLQVMNVRAMGVALYADLPGLPEPAVYGPLSLPPAKTKWLADELMIILKDRKSPLLIDDLLQHPKFAWVGQHARQLIAVPLQRQEEVLGCLFALDKVDGDFDSIDSKLLNSIANESAIYLENAMLFEDVHGLMMGLLHSLTSAVDAKDAYTCGHSERVALISRHLAQSAGLAQSEVDRIYMAGLLHDVGKIGVPESVLQKTGRLTPEEFEQMKKHPLIGSRILADVKQLQTIIPGVLHHHERFDGKGYPAGLSGHNIPVMGRIICLADCFDAMTSNRTYRKALPIEVAMTEIRRCSGTQFDPSLAEAFLRTTPEALRELLSNHQLKSKQLLDMQESLRPPKA